MGISRRRFVGGGLAAGLGVGLVAGCSSDDASRGTPTTTTTTGSVPSGSFEEFLTGRGYTSVAAAPLITGQEFNGGLRFDDDTSAYTPRSFVTQQAARVEDAAKPSTPGTLPFFTIVGLETSTQQLAEEAATAVLEYLTAAVGLDPTRLRATTTDRSSAFFPLLERFGLTQSQIRLRPFDEAVRDGSGSGYFAPVGHPGNPSAPSFSIEYVLPDATELEIAEITHGDGTNRTSGGIGVERVAMARSGVPTSWADALPAFTAAVQAESARTGVPLPAGFQSITGAATPTSGG